MQTATKGPEALPFPAAIAPSLGPGSSSIRPSEATASVPSSRLATAPSSLLTGSLIGSKDAITQNPLR